MRPSFYKMAKNWKTRREHFGSILVDMTGEGRIHCLNDTATDIASLCQMDAASRTEIESVLAQVYSSSSFRTDNSIQVFLDRLTKEGILVKMHKRVGNMDLAQLKDDIISCKNSVGKLTRLVAPYEISIYPTTRCNLDCKFCYLSKGVRNGYRPGVISKETLTEVMEESVKNQVLAVNFLGGEPFLAWSVFSDLILEYSGELLINITTNGTLVPFEKKDEKVLSKPGVDLKFSIHSSIPERHDQIVGVHGAWHRAMKSAERLAHSGVVVSIQIVPTRSTDLSDILSLMKMAKDIGARSFFVSYPFPGWNMTLEYYSKLVIPPTDFGRIASEMNRYREEYGDTFHVFSSGTFAFVHDDLNPVLESPLDHHLTLPGGGNVSLEIMPDGSVFASCLDVGVEEKALGRIGEVSLDEIWDSTELEALRRVCRQPSEPCKSCQYFQFCKGGNHLLAERLLGNRHLGDPRCPKVWQSLDESRFKVAGSGP